MFYEVIETTIKPDGTAEVKPLATGKTFAEAEFAATAFNPNFFVSVSRRPI